MTIRLLGTRCYLRAVSVLYSAAYMRGAVGIGMSVCILKSELRQPKYVSEETQLSSLSIAIQ